MQEKLEEKRGGGEEEEGKGKEKEDKGEGQDQNGERGKVSLPDFLLHSFNELFNSFWYFMNSRRKSSSMLMTCKHLHVTMHLSKFAYLVYMYSRIKIQNVSSTFLKRLVPSLKA